MKALVTGAGGFLGSRVVLELLERGHRVRAILRPASGGAPAEWKDRAEIVRGDLRSPAQAEEWFKDMDVLVHLAAAVRGTPEAQFAGTVVGTEKLLEAMKKSAVRRLVLASSFSVYDWTAARGHFNEETPLESKPYERDGYTVAKLWQEKVARRMAEENRWTLAVLRPGFIYGPGGPEVAGAGVKVKDLYLVIAPFSRLPLTYVDNCACAFADAAEKDVSGTFNIVDDENVSAWRYAGRLTGGKLPLVPVPYLFGLGTAYAAKLTSRLLFPPRGGKLPGLLDPRRYRARFRPFHFENERAKKILGWQNERFFEKGCALT